MQISVVARTTVPREFRRRWRNPTLLPSPAMRQFLENPVQPPLSAMSKAGSRPHRRGSRGLNGLPKNPTVSAGHAFDSLEMPGFFEKRESNLALYPVLGF